MAVMDYLICLVIFSITRSNAEMLGKFVFHGDKEQHDSTLNVLHKPDSVHFAPSPGSIPSNEIASILALSLGLSVPEDIKWAGLQVSNPFNLPRAVMMLSIDNLPKGHKLKLPSTATFPVDQVDGVTSISDMYHVSSRYSLASHLGAIFEGRSKIVSISADEKVAGSGHSNTRLSATSVWSDLTNSWKLINGEGEVKDALSKKQVLKRISSVLISGYVYNEQQQIVTVNIKGLELSYNLDDKTDFKLFSELVYMLWQHEEIEHSKALVRDGAPDLYQLSISALKGIEKKYGADSKQMQGALLLIEKFVEKIVKKFVQLYDGNIFIVGVTVISDTDFFVANKDKFKPALKLLQESKVMLANFDNSGPEIHVVNKMESDAQQKLCEAIQRSVAHSNKFLKFKCANELPVHRLAKRSLLEYVDNPEVSEADRLNLSSYYDDMFPVIFNMWFWLMVVLALTVYATSLAMWNMDPGRDSIIYRLTQQKIKSE